MVVGVAALSANRPGCRPGATCCHWWLMTRSAEVWPSYGAVHSAASNASRADFASVTGLGTLVAASVGQPLAALLLPLPAVPVGLGALLAVVAGGGAVGAALVE